ncbi:unnamed protein product [Rotaria sp. Silwood2]|nr:unnamed protein product [Rotaria sp. Silwood2]CAF4853192.1 unnamed protein product [Rotaria sp. Silwood2]
MSQRFNFILFIIIKNIISDKQYQQSAQAQAQAQAQVWSTYQSLNFENVLGECPTRHKTSSFIYDTV